MFGVVPKALWERCCHADEKNRIPLSLTCLLIRAQGKNILVDTGLGDKEDPRFYQRFAVDRTPTLRESLQQFGLRPEYIHRVINTHLHFDHAGGNTVRESSGALISTFPNAAYVVQQGENVLLRRPSSFLPNLICGVLPTPLWFSQLGLG